MVRFKPGQMTPYGYFNGHKDGSIKQGKNRFYRQGMHAAKGDAKSRAEYYRSKGHKARVMKKSGAWVVFATK